jgi:hypothetical protein
MTGPLLALRNAILAHLAQDADLVAAMGGALELHDEPPRGIVPVYAQFGDAVARDWSSDLVEGHEQILAIAVWARPGSGASALLVADRMQALLHDAELARDGHNLVSLRVTACEITRDERSGRGRATLRLRALSERV